MVGKSDTKWHMYAAYILIVAVFAMVIYLVVVGTQQDNNYYVTLSFFGDDSATDVTAPIYPVDNSGNLNGGLEVVRNALVDLANNTDNLDMNVPVTSAWSFSSPVHYKGAGGGDYVWNYTFPFPQAMSGKNGIAEYLIDNELTVAEFFANSSDDVQTWANTVFGDANDVRVSVTYGTRDSVAAISYPPNA